jgi:CheY-like chemotaxis protein
MKSFSKCLFPERMSDVASTGLELYDQLHAKQGLEDIPAIMLSAKLPIREIQQRNIACMSKPYKLAELFRLIEKLIS